MDRTERFYKIKNLLRGTGAVPTATLLRELEVSRATLHRDLEYLRDRMDTPIVYDQVRRGYRLNDPAPDALRHELPGLWFSSREAHALLTFHSSWKVFPTRVGMNRVSRCARRRWCGQWLSRWGRFRFRRAGRAGRRF